MKYLWSMNVFGFLHLLCTQNGYIYSGYVSLCCFLEITIYIQSSNILLKSITNRFIYSTYIINIIKSLSDHDSSLMQVYFVCHLSLSYFSGIWFFSIIYDLLSISLCFSVSSVCKLVIATFIQNPFISLCCEFLWFCTTHYFSVLSLHSLCLVRRLFIYIILAY